MRYAIDAAIVHTMKAHKVCVCFYGFGCGWVQSLVTVCSCAGTRPNLLCASSFNPPPKLTYTY